MTILIGLSSLPFFPELIIQIDGTPAFSWVPDWNIERTLTDTNGKFLGYSKYRIFLYFLLIQIYALIAWLGWFSVSKNKPYKLAILLGVICSSYHIFLILSNNRATYLNGIDIKLVGSAIIGCILFLVYYFSEKKKKTQMEYAQKKFGHKTKKIITFRVILVWLFIFAASTFPYFHDIITLRGTGIKDWVPQFGIENALTDSAGYVWGFNSYRVFILTLSLQIFAQIGWAGWLHDSAYKLYRPFLVVPVGLSLYQIVVILMDQTGAYLNSPDIKLMIIFIISSVVCFFYFFRNKRFNQIEIDSKTVTAFTQNQTKKPLSKYEK